MRPIPSSEREVDLLISTFPSKFAGYQSKAGSTGTITLFVGVIWNQAEVIARRHYPFADIEGLFEMILLETYVIERLLRGLDEMDLLASALRAIVEPIAMLLCFPDRWKEVREDIEAGRKSIATRIQLEPTPHQEVV